MTALITFRPSTSSPPLNGTLFHELLQPLHGIKHHPVDSGDWRSGRRPLAPPTSKRRYAHTEERRSLLLANVSLLSLCLRLRRSPKPGNHTTSNPLDEFWSLV